MEIQGDVMSFANIEVAQVLMLEIDRYQAHVLPTTQQFDVVMGCCTGWTRRV